MSAPNAATSSPAERASTNYKALLDQAWADATAPRAPDAPTVISTFAGGGGSLTGYAMAGYHDLLAVEWNDHAIATLAANYPDLPTHHGDIAALSVDQVLEQTGLSPGDLDVLDGSPPCQGFSTAGKRQLDDPRNQLFREYTRLLRGLQPKTFVMENVSGMIKGSMKLVFAEILRELKAAGYKVSARLLNAMYFGVPQSRERMIFIGVRDDLNIEPTHPQPRTRPIPIRNAIADLPPTMDEARDHIWIDESPQGRNTKTYPLAARTKQGTKYAGQQRRFKWTAPAGTITKPSSDEQNMPPYLRSSGCHPLHTRTFSLLEYKRLASFPDSYKFPGEWHLGIHRIGNSVPPLMMKAIAEHVRNTVLEPVREEAA